MKIFDAHCDVLWRMWENRKLSFSKSNELHIDFEKLKKTGGKVQCFAIYVPEKVSIEGKFAVALEMVDMFYEKILLPNPTIKLVTSKKDLEQLKVDETGAILTLEGCDSIGSDLGKLRTLYRLGVRSVGLTWNYPNACADGVLEERGGGLTSFGKEVIQFLNSKNMWVDVSHLSEKSFWDTAECASTLIASHSNTKSLCNNARNLTDDQIRTIIEKNGRIGVTFVPKFVNVSESPSIHHVISHVEHIASLGGISTIGFGSDFDGIDETIKGLNDFRGYETLINELLKMYSEQEVKGFCYENLAASFNPLT